MEHILDVYEMPYDPRHPKVCFDESSKQLIKQTRLPARPGQVRRVDYEYRRMGTRNLFMFFAPLTAWRHVEVTDQRTMQDFAHQMRWLVDVAFPDAERIDVIMDNLNTHKPASLYETFPPAEANRILRRLVFHYTPSTEAGSTWLKSSSVSSCANSAPISRMKHLSSVRSPPLKMLVIALIPPLTGSLRPMMPVFACPIFTRHIPID